MVKVTVNLSLCVPRRHIRRSRTICSTDSWHTQGVSCTHPQLPGESCHGNHWTACWVGQESVWTLWTRSKVLFPPVIEPWTVQPQRSHYTPVTTLTQLLCLQTSGNVLTQQMAVGNTVSPDCCCSTDVLMKLPVSAAVPHFPRFACQPAILLFLVSSLSFLPSARFRNLLCI